MPRITETIKKYIKDKKYKNIIILGIAGLLLISLSALFPKEGKTDTIKESDFDIENYRKLKEKELKSFILKIDGVLDCSVMISYKDKGTTLFSFNSVTSLEKEEEKKESEMVIRRENGDEYPVTERITLPEIAGITVIADAKKGMEIKLAKAVSAAIGAEIHNVEVIINERN